MERLEPAFAFSALIIFAVAEGAPRTRVKVRAISAHIVGILNGDFSVIVTRAVHGPLVESNSSVMVRALEGSSFLLVR